MSLQEKLGAKRFVITAEITPPVSASRDELLAKAMPLKGLADAVNVTDGAGARAHLGAVTAASILLQAGIEPILQFTCRDRNRIALQSDLLAAAALGIRNLLLLKGDDPKQGVVDANSKVHGVANLHVAGSSVFPTYGSSNPTLNLVALALRLGDHLKTVLA